MAKTELENRTFRFSLRIVEFVGEMSRSHIGTGIRQQLLRSGTSIAANYREAQWAESRNDFLHKIEIATKEAAETLYWLELIDQSPALQTKGTSQIVKEAGELLAILSAIGRTLKKRGGEGSESGKDYPR